MTTTQTTDTKNFAIIFQGGEVAHAWIDTLDETSEDFRWYALKDEMASEGAVNFDLFVTPTLLVEGVRLDVGETGWPVFADGAKPAKYIGTDEDGLAIYAGVHLW